MTNHIHKKTPPRLREIFSSQTPPLYFITINTLHRRPALASQTVFDAFIEYARRNAEQGRCVGCFTIMPEHIHYFVRIPPNNKLSNFVRLMKQFIGKEISNTQGQSAWQPGFFNHLLRSSESYADKWTYTRMNPVRAGYVEYPDMWPWQGEIVKIDRA
jgi:putative transposase